MTTSAPGVRTFPRHPDFPILLVTHAERGRRFVDSLVGRRPHFMCVAAHTDTSDIDGLSAAGATPALRRLTAAADLETLFHGRPLCMDGVPSNPLGAPGPVLITRAALRTARLDAEFVDAGLRTKPRAPTRSLSQRWGASIVTGRAVPHAAALFEAGLRLGAELATSVDYLVLGETVPGGTTTALAVLCGLGFDAWDKVSSSMQENPHQLKRRVVGRALAAAGFADQAGQRGRNPLEVVAAVGDPMQPVVAGIALATSLSRPVVLAGGTQMVAVVALASAIARRQGRKFVARNLAIATTRWVACDPMSDLAGLARAVGSVPVVACDLSFAGSRHPPLRRYEQFLVKEGVGAGGAAVCSMLSVGVSSEALAHEVDAVYEEIYAPAVR